MLTLEAVEIRQGDFVLTADLEIAAGARVALLGPSGGGKSTLLSAIAGFVTPQAGRILWQGRDLGTAPPGARPVSILFQDNNLFAHLSIADNVGLGLRPDLRLSSDERARVCASLERVGLGGYAARKPAALSGGQMARVALARVLLRARPLLLLDEPFASLGPALKIEMLDLVRELVDEAGTTLLMVSHDPLDARRIADQVIVVSDGMAHPPSPTDEVLNNPPAALRAYLGK